MEIVGLIFCAAVIAFLLFIFALLGKLSMRLRDLSARCDGLSEDVVLKGGPADGRKLTLSLWNREIRIPTKMNGGFATSADNVEWQWPKFDCVIYKPAATVYEYSGVTAPAPPPLPDDVSFRRG